MTGPEWTHTSAPYLKPRAAGQADAWAAEAAAGGRRGTQRIVAAQETPAPADVAELLGVSPEHAVVVRRRVMFLDDSPTELTDSYYPLEIARGTPLAGTAKIRGGAVTLLAELGHVAAVVREEVAARMPSPAEREALALSEGEPVLTLLRVTLDADGYPYQVDASVFPAATQRLRYEVRETDVQGR